MRRSNLTKHYGQADGQDQESERIHLLLLDDARRGLADIAAGRCVEADSALAQRQQQRAAVSGQPMRRSP